MLQSSLGQISECSTCHVSRREVDGGEAHRQISDKVENDLGCISALLQSTKSKRMQVASSDLRSQEL